MVATPRGRRVYAALRFLGAAGLAAGAAAAAGLASGAGVHVSPHIATSLASAGFKTRT